MGPVVSKFGFELSDIEANCDLFINGHLHNQYIISDKALNLGNLTGKDFGEDAFKYSHGVLILDTDYLLKTHSLQELFAKSFLENPYAFNFYKLEINNIEDISKLKYLKNNAIVSIKCIDSLLTEVKNILNENLQISEYRLIAVHQNLDPNETNIEKLSTLTMDHLAKFVEYCMSTFEISDALTAELAEICK